MRLAGLTMKLLQLAQVLHTWVELLTGLEISRRRRISVYADQIAETLSRAAQALVKVTGQPRDRIAARQVARELGRISGYVEDIVALLHDHLDGRKLAGVKRRLEAITRYDVPRDFTGPEQARLAARQQIRRLMEAEGYFRALADGLRV